MENEDARKQIVQQLQNLSADELRKKADLLLNEQTQYDNIIDHMASKNNGNPLQFYAAWHPMLWQANETSSQKRVRIDGKEMPVCDMDYYIAESLQTLQSGQDPEAEYNGWIEQAKQIYHDMKSDGTTLQELHARSDFVATLDSRETDLKRVISLYSGAAFNSNCPQQAQAQEKLKFLTFKLDELRKLRERVQNIKPTLPHSEEERRKIQTHTLGGSFVPYIEYGSYETYTPDETKEESDFRYLDKSSAALALAASMTAIELYRLQYRQAQQLPGSQTNSLKALGTGKEFQWPDEEKEMLALGMNSEDQLATDADFLTLDTGHQSLQSDTLAEIPTLGIGQKIMLLSGRTSTSGNQPHRGFTASEYLRLSQQKSYEYY